MKICTFISKQEQSSFLNWHFSLPLPVVFIKKSAEPVAAKKIWAASRNISGVLRKHSGELLPKWSALRGKKSKLLHFNKMACPCTFCMNSCTLYVGFKFFAHMKFPLSGLAQYFLFHFMLVLDNTSVVAMTPSPWKHSVDIRFSDSTFCWEWFVL